MKKILFAVLLFCLVSVSCQPNVKAKDEYGNTALMLAARNGEIETLNSLIATGAEIEAKDDDGWTALMDASWKGQVASIKALLAAGANIEARNNSGETPLILAAREGQVEVIKLLLEEGANVKAMDRSLMWSALDWAISEGHTEAEKLLRDAFKERML